MTDQSTPPSGDTTEARRSEALILAILGLGVAGVLLATAALPVLISREESSAASPATQVVASQDAAPTTAPVDQQQTAVTAAPIAPATTAPVVEQTTTTTAPPAATATSIAPESTEATPTSEPEATIQSTVPALDDGDETAEVAESRAVIEGGQIFLVGAVPDEATRDEIVGLAAQIFGEANVIDGYIIDPRATDAGIGNIDVADAVLFEAFSATIRPEFEPLLEQGLALLNLRPATTFIIEGHTNSVGPADENLVLSQNRAGAVALWYISRGIDPSRLTAIGKGETELIASDDTAEGKAANRRIEVTIENLLVEP